MAFVDHLTQWATGNKYNLAYTNAIDLLAKARANGFQVFYNGSGTPQPGDIWVTRTYGHPYGHTGIFVTGGGQPVTLEQNVDGNADALTNGGWVRRKQRLLYANGTMNYSPWLETQTLVGWFRLPLDNQTTTTTAAKAVVKKGKKTGMYGSHLFSVKEGDNEFVKGAVYLYNTATNAVTGMHNSEELKYVQENYRKSYGEEMRMETYSTQAPTYRRLFAGLNTDTKGGYTQLNDVKKQLTAITNKLNQVESTVKTDTAKTVELPNLAGSLKGNDIANKQTFKASVNLNIREAASITANKVAILQAGEAVDIVGSATADGYYWISFMRNNKLVYVASKVQGGDTYGEVFS